MYCICMLEKFVVIFYEKTYLHLNRKTDLYTQQISSDIKYSLYGLLVIMGRFYLILNLQKDNNSSK